MVSEADASYRQKPFERHLAKARAFVDAYFPDIATNPATRRSLQTFFADGVFLPDDQAAIEQEVRGRLNGLSGEIFGTKNKEDMLPGQPVNIASGVLSPAIQNPH